MEAALIHADRWTGKEQKDVTKITGPLATLRRRLELQVSMSLVTWNAIIFVS